jgi:hypothetical protein
MRAHPAQGGLKENDMATHDTRPNGVHGAAIDAPRDRRPGVPKETPPHPAGAAHWDEPEPQRDPGYVLKRKNLEKLTPVFGTAVPPRGVSGMIRRAAFRIPEYKTSHWFLLLLADRVDAMEHGSRRWMIALPLVALGGAAVVATRSRRRRWFR